MTRSELRSEVEERTGRTDKSTRIDTLLDLGIRELTKYHDFEEIRAESDLTTVASQAYVALPTNTRSVVEARMIDGTNSWPLVIKRKKWLTDRIPNVSALSEGKPVYAYKEGDNFYLLRIPDDAYTVRVTVYPKPSDFASDATENPVELLDEALIGYAAEGVLLGVEEYEAAAQWNPRWKAALLQAIRQDNRSHVDVVGEPHGAVLSDTNPTPWLDPFVGHDSNWGG